MLEIGLAHYLTVAAILFTLGLFGVFLNRKNIIIILMSIELMLLAVNINMVAFSAELQDLVGQVFAMFILTVAAAEAAILLEPEEAVELHRALDIGAFDGTVVKGCQGSGLHDKQCYSSAATACVCSHRVLLRRGCSNVIST